MSVFDNKYKAVCLIAAVIIALDQLTKYLINATVPLYARIEVLPGLLDIIHIRNSGIAFGLFKQFGSEYRVLSLAAITAVTLLLIAYLTTQVRQQHRLEITSLSLILGGAVGNLIDRFRVGEVIDFVDVYWRTWHWPAFNLADSAISIGMVLFLFCEIFKKKHAGSFAGQGDE
jgi:signal peptidase II